MNPSLRLPAPPSARHASIQLHRLLLPYAAVAGLALLSGCDEPQRGAAALSAAPAAEVSVQTVRAGAVPITIELPGRTSPYLIAEVRPQVGGIIVKRPFDEGAEIKAGDLLYQIDPASYQAAYDSARATLDKSEATLSSLELKASRYKQLSAIKAVSQQDYDDAAAALNQARADIAVSRAALETAQINLAYTRVTSPISGRIGRSAFTQGALVTANQSSALATVQQLDPIYVDVTQSSTEIMRLRRELASGALTAGAGTAKVKLFLDDGAPYDLEGALAFSEVTVDQGTGSITLRAVFPNPKTELLPGMYVRADIQQGVNENAILLPQQGVTRDQRGEPIAFFVDAGGKAQRRALKIARAIGDKWLVTDGAADGDQLIVEGLQRVRPGSPVKVAVKDGVAALAADAGPARFPQSRTAALPTKD